ncbi:MAG: hypothetical protein KAX49_11760 [Halanaerobiales bacterium]|nr:hypothetical protein [Halanaerobiales bacterium]
MKIRSLSEIGKLLDDISKKEKCYFSLTKSFGSHGYRNIGITTSDILPKHIKKQIADFLGVSIFLEKQADEKGILMEGGEIKNYGNEKSSLSLIFFNAYECRLIRKEKKQIKVIREIKPAVTEEIIEEKEVPVYECPEGEIRYE